MDKASIRSFNCLHSEVSAVYHDAAVRMGVSDSVQSILYIVCESGGRCLQSDIYRQTGISRQTINTAIRKLEREGVVRLEQGRGRNTVVCLTEAGEAFADRRVRPLIRAEEEAFESWSAEELRLYIELTERFRDALRQRVEALHG